MLFCCISDKYSTIYCYFFQCFANFNGVPMLNVVIKMLNIVIPRRHSGVSSFSPYKEQEHSKRFCEGVRVITWLLVCTFKSRAGWTGKFALITQHNGQTERRGEEDTES